MKPTVVRRTNADFPAPTPQATPCRLWQGKLHNGYGRKFDRSKKRTEYIHRWVWKRANGPIPDGMCVCHHCDNTACYRYEHLFLGTKNDNTQDMIRKGRARRGQPFQRGHMYSIRKLTQETVDSIRSEYTIGGVTQDTLGRKYGVDQTTVGRIVRGVTWRQW